MINHVLTANENIITDEKSLTDVFFDGCKSPDAVKKIGVEFEKLPVNKNTFKAATYADVSGFLRLYEKSSNLNDWQEISENGAVLGLKGNLGTVTLEPGSQTELSLIPTEKISDIKRILQVYNKTSSDVAQKLGIYWLGYGVQPVSVYKNIKIIPKKRYEYMTKYLPTVAKKPLVMMRETSGIQASFDYVSEEDAMKKFQVALKLSPIISAAYSNSPVRNSRLTKYKSYRASSWLDTDNDRCGLVSSRVFKGDFSFEDYAQILLDVPMIFIEKEINGVKTAIKTENLTFRNYLKNGYQGFFATKQDWLLHLSLYFPDVRLKNYIEIRNHDNQRFDLIPSVPAFWKGIMYNESARESVCEVIKDLSYFEFEYLRQKTPKTGLDVKIKKHNLKDIAYEIIKISYDSLKSQKQDEEKFLEPLIDLVSKGLTPADLIIQKWENEWNQDVSKLVEYSRLM